VRGRHDSVDTVDPPAWQVVSDVRGITHARVHVALLAAACDATVCLWLRPEERDPAGALGLRMERTPRDAREALIERGFALLDPDATAWAAAREHPGRPRRVIAFECTDTEARATLARLAEQDLDSALVVADDGAWQLVAGRMRRAKVPGRGAFGPLHAEAIIVRNGRMRVEDERIAAGLAHHAACVLWCARWLPRFDDTLAWTREKLQRGVDLTPYRR
jgi:hypothetical protein